MSQSTSKRRQSTHLSSDKTLAGDDASPAEAAAASSRRVVTVYDAVAGRIGLNGFLSKDRLDASHVLGSLPEEELLRRVGAPDEIPFDFYNADERLSSNQRLPDSDLVKAVHAYASDFYTATSVEGGDKDYRTFDGSALLALGVLLEEASRDVLGETGDMALVEPEGIENTTQASKITKHQIIGRVKPRRVLQPPEPPSDHDEELESDSEEVPTKRRRRN